MQPVNINAFSSDYEDYEGEDADHDEHNDREPGTYEIIIDGMGETSRDGGAKMPPPINPGPGNSSRIIFYYLAVGNGGYANII